MAFRANQSRLPVKQGASKKFNAIRKWDNNTRIDTTIYPPKIIPMKNPKPTGLRLLSSDDDMDSFFTKNMDTMPGITKDETTSENNQLQTETESIAFGNGNVQGIKANIPKKNRNYPKPWLITKPARIVDYTYNINEQEPPRKVSEKLREGPTSKRKLAQNQKSIRPQFEPDTKEQVLLQAQSKKEERKLERESKRTNYNDYEPPWRREVTANDNSNPTSKPGSKLMIKPPHMVGVKLKIETKPKKDRVTVKIPRFSMRTEYYPNPIVNRKYSKPWRSENKILTKAADKGAESRNRLAPKKFEDRNGNKMKIPVRKRVTVSNSQQQNILDILEKETTSLDITSHEFTFEDAVKEIHNNTHNGKFTDYEIEIELDEFKGKNDGAKDNLTKLVGTNKPNRIPLITQYFPKAITKPDGAEQIFHHVRSRPATPVITDDENSDFETDVDDSAPDEDKSSKENNKVENPETTIKAKPTIHTQEPLVPNIIRSGEFHANPGSSDASSTSSSENDCSEQITTSQSETKHITDCPTSDENELSEKTKLKQETAKHTHTRLPMLMLRSTKNSAALVHVRPTSIRKLERIASRRQVHKAALSKRHEIKHNENENLFTTMSYTIVQNPDGKGMTKFFEDGTSTVVKESKMSGLRSILFCSSDVKNIHTTGFSILPAKDMKHLGVQTDLFYSGVGITVKNSEKEMQMKNNLLDSYPVVGAKSNKITDLSSNTERQTIPIPPTNNPADFLKLYTQTAYSENEKTCYTADIVWDCTPFTSPNLLEPNFSVGGHVGDEFHKILPPPTPYRDGKTIIDLKDEDEKQNDLEIIQMLSRPHMNSDYPYETPNPSTYSPMGLNIINLNYVSSSSSQSLGKSKRQNKRAAGNKQENYTKYFDKQQSQVFQNTRHYQPQQLQQHQQDQFSHNNNNFNSYSYLFSQNRQYDPYQCINQICEDEFGNLKSDSRLPEGHFLPPIVGGTHPQENHKCQAWSCSCSTNYHTCPQYFADQSQSQSQRPSNNKQEMYKNHKASAMNEYYNSYWQSQSPDFGHQQYENSQCRCQNCQHQCRNAQQEVYWTQPETQNPTNEFKFPFGSLKSSTAFTKIEPSSLFQNGQFLMDPSSSQNNNGSELVAPVPNTGNLFLPSLEGFDKTSIKKVMLQDFNDTTDRESESELSEDSGGYSEDSEEDDETNASPSSKRKRVKSKVNFLQKNLQAADFKSYLLNLFLQKPSTAKRCSNASLPRTKPPPPSAVSEDSSNTSTRVLMSRKAYPLKAIPKCDCLSCRNRNKLGANRSQSMSCLDQIDYIQKNIKDMKKLKKPLPPKPYKIVDHPKGDRVDPLIKFAGRKGYGQVPDYIKKRKEEILVEKQVQLEAQLQQTIQKINTIETKRKKSRRYWINKVATETRQQIEKYYSNYESESHEPAITAKAYKPTIRRDDIFIGSYNNSEEDFENNRNQTDLHGQALQNESKDSSGVFSDLLPFHYLRGGIGSAPGRFRPDYPQKSVSESSLCELKHQMSSYRSLHD